MEISKVLAKLFFRRVLLYTSTVRCLILSCYIDYNEKTRSILDSILFIVFEDYVITSYMFPCRPEQIFYNIKKHLNNVDIKKKKNKNNLMFE